jgi:hypothetical protein
MIVWLVAPTSKAASGFAEHTNSLQLNVLEAAILHLRGENIDKSHQDSNINIEVTRSLFAFGNAPTSLSQSHDIFYSR